MVRAPRQRISGYFSIVCVVCSQPDDPGETPTGLPRLVDAAVAAVGLVVAAPLLAVIAAAVRLTSPGPVLFRQHRVGRGGQPFEIFKFRTMTVANHGASFTARDDKRVTPVGKLLRLSKLDELPELWNVLKGEMSLVGPRPDVPSYVDVDDPLWREVLRARPGLTDPIAITLRDEEAVLAAVPTDREAFYRRVLQPYKLLGSRDYLRRRTWRSDLGILARTVIAVVSPAREAPPSPAEIADHVAAYRDRHD